ncbi:unnamed protein product [Menidia menidia]|uniref:(Atlantic silverside) hypothetical protein n=1 Tax=Menidia menidia TaxID=238744 RepID=A0A8S4BLH9_9TELE|nr:unnamed protein product [Menidia menidia]
MNGTVDLAGLLPGGARPGLTPAEVCARRLLPAAHSRAVGARRVYGESLSGFPEDDLNMMHFLLLFSRQGKLRLQKWFTPITEREKKKVIREMTALVLARPQRTCNFLQWRDFKIIYKRCFLSRAGFPPFPYLVVLFAPRLNPDLTSLRYASLYFCSALTDQENELLALEVLHRYVELLDRYFGNVCELDIIFNFEKAYFILDEFLMSGEILETSKVAVGVSMEEGDALQETMEEYMSKPAY